MTFAPKTPIAEILTALARHREANPGFLVEKVHFFPLGGIRATTDWTAEKTAPDRLAAARA